MSKKGIGTALLIIMQLGQLGWLGWLQYSDWSQTNSTAELQEKVAGLSGDLEALRLDQAELSQELGNLQTSSAARLGEIDVQVEELNQVARAISTSQTDTLEMRVVLAAKLEQLAEDVASLKRTTSAPPAAQPRPAAHPQRRTAPVPAARIVKSAKASPKPAPAPPPFVLLGIETRAGEPFASVARNGAASLDEVQLLRAGEAYQSWKLIRLEDRAAVFFADGEERVVGLR